MKNSNLFLMLFLATGLAAITDVKAMHDPCEELHRAIDRADLDAVKELLANGVDPMCEYNLRPQWPREMYKMPARKLAHGKWVDAVRVWHDDVVNRNPEKMEKAEAIYRAILEKVQPE